MNWTGPHDDEFDGLTQRLVAPVPPERWPYGPPSAHDDGCMLRAGGLYRDCGASDAEGMLP